MGQGPLAEPRLAEIESTLNAGRFDEAQRMLATIIDVEGAEVASAYFATRLLFQRGRLELGGVVQRLRELLAHIDEFPEAERMLQAAEAGVLEPSAEVFRRVTGAPHSAAPLHSPERIGVKILSRQDIPRAPLVPRFTPRTGIPSYAPETPRPPTPPLPVLPALEFDSVRETHPGLGPSAANESAAASARHERERASLPRIPSLEPPSTTAPTMLAPVTPPGPELPRDLSVANAPPEKPAETRGTSPSLFEIAAALDAGHPARALELCARAHPELGPELRLLTARAHTALGDKERAFAELEPLLEAPLLPTLRAAVARVLIELNRPERALEQARRAVGADPDDPVSRVTLAWALLRVMRRSGESALADEAEPLLGTHLREGAIANLLLALRASLAAELADPSRAASLAQRALQNDPHEVDAIAAIALASARLGLRADAERAQQRLFELNSDEAEANQRAILRHGVRLGSPRSEPPLDRERAQRLWGAAEAALLDNDVVLAKRELESACSEKVQAVVRRSVTDSWSRLANAAARLFTELPVFRHFAPFDCSMFSVDRVDAALGLLFGNGGGESSDAVELVVGAYIGESWRQALGADWQGVPTLPLAASVEGVGISTRPCERVRARLRDGAALGIDGPRNLHPGADPLGNSVPLSLCPPAPWDPKPNPSPGEFVELGRALPSSVIGIYCERRLSQPLDHSISGMVALDRYVALLAPAKAPPDPDGAWSRRVAVLLGAYLGETLVDGIGARWDIAPEPSGPESYRLRLPPGTVVTPVARVLDRLAGRRATPLSDYAARLASGRASLPA